MRVYTKKDIKRYEVKEIDFTDKESMGVVAQQLKKEGWEVIQTAYRFPGMIRYFLQASREKNS